MFAVHFYASCFDSRGNLIGKKSLWLDREKAVYRPLFALANTLVDLVTARFKQNHHWLLRVAVY